MGIAISSNLDLSDNEHLLRFVDREPIVPNDPFWSQFLAYNITPATTTYEQLAFESKIEPLCQKLLENNLTSGNVGNLIHVFLVRCQELIGAASSEDTIFNWQCFNALFAIRSVLKYLVELVAEDQFILHIETGHEVNSVVYGSTSRLELLINCLFGIIIDLPLRDITYLVHLEAVTCILVLLSVQAHGQKRADQSNLFRLIMNGKIAIHAPLFVKSLMQNYIDQVKAPLGGFGSNSQSIVLGLASGLWSMLTFRKGTTTAGNLETANVEDGEIVTPLANNSLLLVLVLANNCSAESNPYSQSLFACVNSLDNKPIQPIAEPTSFKIDYDSLYVTLCRKATSDSSTLLLYLLIHKNQTFRTHILNRIDIDHLVIPILKTLYHAPNSSSHHIYMSIIILLILSEYQSFNRTVHEMKLRSITWYTERMLSEVSLGGLLVLVLLRTIQYNMVRMRDKYLHTNCLAALANMSDQFRHLHPYVSQRLVSLFETLAKRYHRLQAQQQHNTSTNSTPSSPHSDTSTNANSPNTREHQDQVSVDVTQDDNAQQQNQQDAEQDLLIVEEVLRMVLEIFNSCLCHQLTNNPNLVYTLLYKREAFEGFKTNVAFQDIVRNIDLVIGYFTNLLSSKSAQHEVDATQVLHIIQQGGKSWPKSKLTKFPDLKFKYVEEEQPEEFFIPYVWALVGQQSTLHWSKETSQLLNNTVC